MDVPDTIRRVRICRPALQDMHHLVMPRLAARAQFRRHVIKLRFWRVTDTGIADLERLRILSGGLFTVDFADGYGLSDGFRIVFCEVPNPCPDGTICVLAVMRVDEPVTSTTLKILRGRERIVRERLID